MPSHPDPDPPPPTSPAGDPPRRMAGIASPLRTLRTLLRSPHFTLPVLLVLALGIGATTTVFGTLRTILFQDLPYRTPDRIVCLRWPEKANPMGRVPLSWPLFQDLQERLRGSEALAVIQDRSMVLTGGREPEQVAVGGVTRDFFRVFEARPLLGTLRFPDEDPHGVILTEGFWRSHFGRDPKVLGQSLTLNGASHPILGVLPPRVRLRQRDLFMLHQPGPEEQASRYDLHLTAFARLKPGISQAGFQKELDGVGRSLGEAFGGLDLKHELKASGFQAELRAQQGHMGLLAGLASLLLFLIALVNLSGQFFLRSIQKAPDIAVRKALGASGLQAIGAILGEAVLLSLGGALLSLGVTWAGLRCLSPLVSTTLQANRAMELDGGLLAFALLAALGVNLILAALPAGLLMRMHLPEVLKEGGRAQAGGGSRKLHRGLVTLQLGLALALLANFGILGRSLLRLQGADLGFKPRNLATFGVAPPLQPGQAPRLEAQCADLESRLRALPGVEEAGCVSLLPVAECGFNYTPQLHGDPLPDGTWIEKRTASPSLFRALGVPLLAGRFFQASDLQPDGWNVAIVSRSAASACWPGKDPLGMELSDGSGSGWCRVVGVVEDVRNAGPKEDFGLATAYFPHRLGFGAKTTFVLRLAPGRPIPAAAIRQAVHDAMPGTPALKLRTMEQVLSEHLERERVLTQGFGLASSIALVLALTGLYGAMGFTVLVRTPEFGVRIALGARPGQLLGEVLREGLTVTLVGCGLGTLLTLVSSRTLVHLVPGLAGLDFGSLGGAALVLAAGALASSLIPALRAAGLDPASALREG